MQTRGGGRSGTGAPRPSLPGASAAVPVVPLRPFSESGWPCPASPGKSPQGGRNVCFAKNLQSAPGRAHHAPLTSHRQPAATGAAAGDAQSGRRSSSPAVPRPSPPRAQCAPRRCGQPAMNGDKCRKLCKRSPIHCAISTGSRCFPGRAALGHEAMGGYRCPRPEPPLPIRFRVPSPVALDLLPGFTLLGRVSHAIPSSRPWRATSPIAEDRPRWVKTSATARLACTCGDRPGVLAAAVSADS